MAKASMTESFKFWISKFIATISFITTTIMSDESRETRRTSPLAYESRDLIVSMVKYVVGKKGWHKTGFVTLFKILPYNTNFPPQKIGSLTRAVRRIKKQKVGRRIFFECVACHVTLPSSLCWCTFVLFGGSSCGVLGSYGFLWNEVRDGIQDLARLSRHLVLAIKEARTQVGD